MAFVAHMFDIMRADLEDLKDEVVPVVGTNIVRFLQGMLCTVMRVVFDEVLLFFDGEVGHVDRENIPEMTDLIFPLFRKNRQ